MHFISPCTLDITDLHQQITIIAFQVMKYKRDWQRFRIQSDLKVTFIIHGPAVFSCNMTMIPHRVFVGEQQESFSAEQACFLVACNPLVYLISSFSFSLWGNEVHFSDGLEITYFVALAAITTSVMVMLRNR